MKKSIITTILVLSVLFGVFQTTFATDFKSEWGGFNTTSQTSPDSDGLKSMRTYAIQTILVSCTMYTINQGIATDGSFGPATKAAVVRYQTDEGIDNNGVVGYYTWRHLYDEMWDQGHNGGYYWYYSTGYSGGEPEEFEVPIIRRGDSTGRWQVYKNGWTTFEYAS